MSAQPFMLALILFTIVFRPGLTSLNILGLIPTGVHKKRAASVFVALLWKMG